VALGVAVITLGTWAVTKRRWELYADLLDPAYWAPNFLALLPSRAAGIALGFLKSGLSIGPWYPGWGFLWILAPVALIRTVKCERLKDEFAIRLSPFAFLIGAHFAGAAIAYLVTPADLGSHISTSLDRLLLHVAPAALLVILVALVRTKPETFGAR
jgi:hypothetical protein